MKKLMASGIEITFDLKYMFVIMSIMVIAVAFPFYNVLQSVGGQMLSNSEIPMQTKQELISYIESLLLIRFSLTVLLITVWTYFPKLFYSCKATGEIESTMAMGYSSRQIWVSKGMTTLLMSLLSSVPFVLVIDIAFRIYIYKTLGIMVLFHPMSFLFALILNPILVFGIIMLAGGFQLLTDDVKKSSFSVIILAILNVGTIYATKNISFTSMITVYSIVYSVVILALILALSWLNRKMTCENVILSKMKK